MTSKAKTTETPKPKTVLIRRGEVERRTGISCSTIYSMMEDPTVDPPFPKPVRVGRLAVAWIEKEIEEYLRLITDRRDARHHLGT